MSHIGTGYGDMETRKVQPNSALLGEEVRLDLPAGELADTSDPAGRRKELISSPGSLGSISNTRKQTGGTSLTRLHLDPIQACRKSQIRLTRISILISPVPQVNQILLCRVLGCESFM